MEVKINGLIVVHTEIAEHLASDKEYVSSLEYFFNNIGNNIEKQLQQGSRVYYLSEGSKNSSLKLIPSVIKRHFPQMLFVPMGNTVYE
ncbi:hypothetical protein J4440_05680 [Candidatus Woesearchaeota archaeon]|nr:hypothetical protein [Candidatus Woesearchaeota archaeon]